MGCGGSKTLEDDYDEHNIQNGIAYDKDEYVDFSQNPNEYISKSENYYKNQNPGSGAFSDSLFPPNKDSFYGKDEDSDRRNKSLSKININENDIIWKHAKEIWPEGKIFNEKMSIEDIKIGEVEDSYLIATLSAMAEFPRLILQLFKTVELPEDGSAIEIGLKIDGYWKIIPLDDMFPVNKNSGKPIFGNTITNALWGVFLEKAWAKVNGGYANIITGFPRDVFDALTPFTVLPIDVEKENKKTLWKNIREADAYQCIMTASITEGTDKIEEVGLIANHTFSLVSALEKEINGEGVKLIKLRNPFGSGEWNGDWSDGSYKWNEDNAKEKFGFNGKDVDDGIFWIDYDNFCKYFHDVCICVPLNPLYSATYKIDKMKATAFNVMKIKVPKSGNGQIIFSCNIFPKIYRFHRKITSEQNVIYNMVLAKIDKKKFTYIESSYNEAISTNLPDGEYLLVYNVGYDIAEVEPRKYSINICTSDICQISEMEPDHHFDLLKSIMIPRVEDMKKYEQRFKNKIVLFTGNRFENSSLAFFYIQNKGSDVLHFQPNVYFKNIKSLEGEIPPLKLKKKAKYIYLGARQKADAPFQTGGNGKTFPEEIEGALEPEINDDILQNYRDNNDYSDMQINFKFQQV